MIEFRNVTFGYPETIQPVLRNINLHLPPDSFTLVAGASGVGKSTLIRCINGLVPHFGGGTLSGSITVDGLDPVIETPQVMSHHVGFVFQDPESQFVVDQVEAELAFALENAAVPRQQIRIRIEEVLGLMDLAPLRARQLDTLSGGEKQRVAIAAALALQPSILVLDEPTSQLDPKSAEDVLQSLVRLNTDLGLTIVLVEHRLERVLPYVDRIAYLHDDGDGVLCGTPEAVLPHMALVPPLVTLARQLDWHPLPLTIKQGRAYSRPLRDKLTPASPRRDHPVGEPFIQTKGLAVAYGARTAVKDVDLKVSSGEITALMGRNGAGKTTLLRALVGLAAPQSGTVMVNGESIAGRHTADICRSVGYLPQDPNALLFADTVADELRITLRNHGLDNRQSETRIAALLGELGLAQKAAAYPRDLSAGERQRVALGAVVITQPRALLLDEPTRGLDYQAKATLTRLLQAWRDQGMAILLVTHDVEFVAATANRVLLMSEGEIFASGTTAEILGSSALFSTQVSRLFPGSGLLTPQDILTNLANQPPKQ